LHTHAIAFSHYVPFGKQWGDYGGYMVDVKRAPFWESGPDRIGVAIPCMVEAAEERPSWYFSNRKQCNAAKNGKRARSKQIGQLNKTQAALRAGCGIFRRRQIPQLRLRTDK
jgi:hypothetical protein